MSSQRLFKRRHSPTVSRERTQRPGKKRGSYLKSPTVSTVFFDCISSSSSSSSSSSRLYSFHNALRIGPFSHQPQLGSYCMSQAPSGTLGICSSCRFQRCRVGEILHGFWDRPQCLLFILAKSKPPPAVTGSLEQNYYWPFAGLGSICSSGVPVVDPCGIPAGHRPPRPPELRNTREPIVSLVSW